MANYWHKQTKEPQFKDLFWDKPESKLHAGKLLIIGGNAHSFSAPATAYQAAVKAGVGATTILLPEALKASIGPVFEGGEFAPSNKSGSFSKQALANWLDLANWADSVLIAGDLGRNSETAITLERFMTTHSGLVSLVGDAVDYFSINPIKLLERPNTVLTLGFAQLQKLGMHARLTEAFTYDMPIAKLAENLHTLTTLYPVTIIIKHNHTFFVAENGEISTTPVTPSENLWRVATAASVAVWTLQNPSKIFAASSCAVYELSQRNNASGS